MKEIKLRQQNWMKQRTKSLSSGCCAAETDAKLQSPQLGDRFQQIIVNTGRAQMNRNTSSNYSRTKKHQNNNTGRTKTLQDNSTSSFSNSPQTLESMLQWRHARRNLSASATTVESASTVESCQCSDDFSPSKTASCTCTMDLNGRQHSATDIHFCANCRQLMVSCCDCINHSADIKCKLLKLLHKYIYEVRI